MRWDGGEGRGTFALPPDSFRVVGARQCGSINLFDKLNTDYVMIKNEALSAIANTIKPLHIYKNMHMTYTQDFYKTKQSEIDDFVLEYRVLVKKDLEHPALIE